MRMIVPQTTIISMKGMFFRSVRRRGVSVWPVYIVKIFNKCFGARFALTAHSVMGGLFSNFSGCCYSAD